MLEHVVTVSAIVEENELSARPETMHEPPREEDLARGWRPPGEVERRVTDLALMLEEALSGRLVETTGPGPYVELRIRLWSRDYGAALETVRHAVAGLLDGERGMGWTIVGMGAIAWTSVEGLIDTTRPTDLGYTLRR